jgi:hypothetical protein
MHIYLLEHRHWINNNEYDRKLLGAFSTIQTCEEAILKYQNLPGFSDSPNDFDFKEYPVIGSIETDKIHGVFIVQHEYSEKGEEIEIITLLGVCATKKDAARLIRENRKIAPFMHYQNGFSVDCYPLDNMNWIEGYDTWGNITDK